MSIFGESLMHLALNVELMQRGLGDTKAIRSHTSSAIKGQQLPVLAVYASAVAVAAWLYARPDEEDEVQGYGGRGLAGGAANSSAPSSSYQKYDSSEAAAAEPLWKLSDLPLTLMACGYLLQILLTVFHKTMITNGKHGDIRDRYVPNNVGELCRPGGI